MQEKITNIIDTIAENNQMSTFEHPDIMTEFMEMLEAKMLLVFTRS